MLGAWRAPSFKVSGDPWTSIANLKCGRMRGMMVVAVGEGGRSSGVLVYCLNFSFGFDKHNGPFGEPV